MTEDKSVISKKKIREVLKREYDRLSLEADFWEKEGNQDMATACRVMASQTGTISLYLHVGLSDEYIKI